MLGAFPGAIRLGGHGDGSAGDGQPLTYDAWFALSLNRRRVSLQRSAEIAYGIGLALGGPKAGDRSLFDALADDEDEALEAEMNARAEEAEAAYLNRFQRS